MRSLSLLMIPVLAGGVLCAQGLTKSAIREAVAAVGAVVDDWHLAAAQSDEDRYFAHMAPDAVFMGTDGKERWEKDDFRKWAHPGFKAKLTWAFKASQRQVSLSADGKVAWFDELLDMNGAGTGRGSGVLVKEGDTWLIAQYNLSIPIPRAVFSEVLAVVNSQKPKPADPGPLSNGGER